jgi:hypothetical protein
MRKKEVKLPLTPITEKTFERQGWVKHNVGDIIIDESEDDSTESEGDIFYYTLSLPKERDDEYAPQLISNATDELGILKDIGLKPGQFFVEIANTDGLGLCTSEEELEILYKALVGEDIEENFENQE